MATREVGKKYELSYQDCACDADGWIDATIYRPKPFELMFFKVKRNGKILQETLPGWWTGAVYDGRQLREGDQVVFWKRKPEPEVQDE